MKAIALNPQRPGRFASIAIPWPRGQWVWDKSMNPFRAFVGETEVPCQTERITRYDDNTVAALMVYVDATAPRLEFDPHRESTEAPFEYHERIGEIRAVIPFKRDAENQTVSTMLGAVCRQYRISTPEMEGVVTFFRQCPSVRLDMIVHRANPKSKESYERYLATVTVPNGWEIHYVVEEPLGGMDGLLCDGQDHFVPQRMAREVTAILHPIGEQNWRDVQIDHGLAFADWTKEHAWAPQFFPLADWSHITNLSATQTSDYGACLAAMQAGTAYPSNYATSRRMGYLHPGADQTAGATSGSGIRFGGPPSCGNPDMILHAMYESRFRRDRDRSAMIGANGEPITYEALASEISSKAIRFSADNPGTFDKTGGVVLDGSLGWSKQTPAAASQERTDILAYNTTDWAHRCRVNYWDALLLQLANHWPSRYRLRMEGELARCMLHSDNRLASQRGYANQGLGMNVDRVWGWAGWAMAMAYSLGANTLRDRFRPDMQTLVDCHWPATARNRTLNALTSGKQIGRTPPDNPPTNQDITYGGREAVCVAIQEGLLTQGVYACARAIGSHEAERIAQFAAQAVEWLRDGSQTVWSGAAYNLGAKQPYPTRTIDSSDWSSGSHDSEQTLGLVGFAGLSLLESGDTGSQEWHFVLDVFRAMLGQTPTAALKKRGMGATDSDAVAMAFSQRAGLP